MMSGIAEDIYFKKGGGGIYWDAVIFCILPVHVISGWVILRFIYEK